MANTKSQIKMDKLHSRILEKTGKTNIWIKQDRLNNKCVHKTIKQTLSDNFQQNWNSDTNESSKGKQYRLFKSNTSM